MEHAPLLFPAKGITQEDGVRDATEVVQRRGEEVSWPRLQLFSSTLPYRDAAER